MHLAKTLTILCVFSISVSVFVETTEVEDEPINTWQKFKAVFNKSYGSVEEDAHRKVIFEKTLAFVRMNNGKNGVSLGINSLADLFPDEFFRLSGGVPENINSSFEFIVPLGSATDLPASIDYRGGFGPVEKQNTNTKLCGSCWAFSAAGVVEGVYGWHTGGRQTVNLAKQELVDCSSERYGYKKCRGCGGGNAKEALRYVKEKGIALTAQYPYRMEDGHQCRQQVTPRFIRPGAFQCARLPYGASEDQLKTALKRFGPLSVVIIASDSQFRSYRKGVMTADTVDPKAKTRHVVVLVGYGTTADQKPYWTIRNSWGSGWGEEGYGRLLRDPKSTSAREIDRYPVYITDFKV